MPLNDFMGEAASYTHLGLTFAIAALLGFFGGRWLDGEIGTSPLFTLVGAFLGGAGGFINLIRSLNRIQREREEKEKQAKKSSP